MQTTCERDDDGWSKIANVVGANIYWDVANFVNMAVLIFLLFFKAKRQWYEKSRLADMLQSHFKSVVFSKLTIVVTFFSSRSSQPTKLGYAHQHDLSSEIMMTRVNRKYTQVHYMSFDRFLLAIESRDLSQADKFL